MVFTFGEWEVDEDLFELRMSGTVTPVQPKALDLLLYLLRNDDRVVPKKELLDEVWSGVRVTDNALVQAVAAVRAALGDADASMIVTVRSRGYRFALPVERGGGSARSSLRPRAFPRAPRVDRAPASARDAPSPLASSLESALDGGVGVVIVDAQDAGELAGALDELAAASPLIVLRGEVSSAGTPLEVWRRAAGHCLELDTSGELALELDEHAAGLGLADAVLDLLERAATRGRVVVVLDRLDRADIASLLLFALFAHAADTSRGAMALVATVDLEALSRGGGAVTRVLTQLAMPALRGGAGFSSLESCSVT